MTPEKNPEAPATQVKAAIKETQNTALVMFLLLSTSAAVIMAQDTLVNWNTPRLSTIDATAQFTKTVVIHGLWFLTCMVFIVINWFAKPTRLWKLHIVFGVIVAAWTAAVIIVASADTHRLTLTTWTCSEAPASNEVTEEFLESCTLRDAYADILLGPNIYLWSVNDANHWRWIVAGQGRATIQTRWPSSASAMFMAPNTENATFLHESVDATRGGTWVGSFDPQEHHHLNLYYIEADDTDLTPATPQTRMDTRFHAVSAAQRTRPD